MVIPTRIRAEWSDYVALVDTNVLLDIYTITDWQREHERCGLEDLDGARFVYRRARARESLLLAMYFNQVKALTYGLNNEVLRTIVRASPPAQQTELSTHYTTFFVHFVSEQVLPDWRHTWEDGNDEGLSGTKCDDRLLVLAEEHSLPIITNEGFTETGTSEFNSRSLRTKAKAHGVPAYSPREFWCGKLDEKATIQRFLDRFRQHAPHFINANPHPRTAEDSLTIIHGYYLHVLLGITEGREAPVRGEWCL